MATISQMTFFNISLKLIALAQISYKSLKFYSYKQEIVTFSSLKKEN
jgi:hypothetical protein